MVSGRIRARPGLSQKKKYNACLWIRIAHSDVCRPTELTVWNHQHETSAPEKYFMWCVPLAQPANNQPASYSQPAGVSTKWKNRPLKQRRAPLRFTVHNVTRRRDTTAENNTTLLFNRSPERIFLVSISVFDKTPQKNFTNFQICLLIRLKFHRISMANRFFSNNFCICVFSFLKYSVIFKFSWIFTKSTLKFFSCYTRDDE